MGYGFFCAHITGLVKIIKTGYFHNAIYAYNVTIGRTSIPGKQNDAPEKGEENDKREQIRTEQTAGTDA